MTSTANLGTRAARRSAPRAVIAAAAALAMLLLAGCATAPPRVTDAPVVVPEPAREPGTYAIVPGRDPATIAPLRAAPPSDDPQWIESTDVAGEAIRQRERGLLRIANAVAFSDDDAGRAWLRDQAARGGADTIVVHRPVAGEGTVESFESGGRPALLAAYFVRIRPPFGASFRDLTADERARLRLAGGARLGNVIGESPAAAANLLPGDIVLKVGGAAIADRTQLQAALRAKAGQPVALTIRRDGMVFTRTVRLGALPSGDVP